MSDISKINVDGVDYDVKDVTARNKLDGKIDSEVTLLSTTSLTDAALNQPENTVKNYAMTGNEYTGNDLPSDPYRYGNATVFKRYAYITLVLWGDRNSPKIAMRYYNRVTGQWTNWFITTMTEVTGS